MASAALLAVLAAELLEALALLGGEDGADALPHVFADLTERRAPLGARLGLTREHLASAGGALSHQRSDAPLLSLVETEGSLHRVELLLHAREDLLGVAAAVLAALARGALAGRRTPSAAPLAADPAVLGGGEGREGEERHGETNEDDSAGCVHGVLRVRAAKSRHESHPGAPTSRESEGHGV
jgi:hypothetical protein